LRLIAMHVQPQRAAGEKAATTDARCRTKDDATLSPGGDKRAGSFHLPRRYVTIRIATARGGRTAGAVHPRKRLVTFHATLWRKLS
jgi:hypothetical protein